ncbi:hypothetical protein ACC754_38040, partial [Rhizobium johnstonii]
SAAREGLCATVVSGAVAAPLLTQCLLVKARVPLPSRQFAILRHKQRHSSRASLALETICREDKAAECGFCIKSINVKRIDDAMKQTTGAVDHT